MKANCFSAGPLSRFVLPAEDLRQRQRLVVGYKLTPGRPAITRQASLAWVIRPDPTMHGSGLKEALGPAGGSKIQPIQILPRGFGRRTPNAKFAAELGWSLPAKKLWLDASDNQLRICGGELE